MDTLPASKESARFGSSRINENKVSYVNRSQFYFSRLKF